MKILQASFFWRNDAPCGLGLTLSGPEFSPEELTEMFDGKTVRQYFRDSDSQLGSQLAQTYIAQLAEIAAEAARGEISLQSTILAAFNIMYLADRGFMSNDEFNGPLFVYERS